MGLFRDGIWQMKKYLVVQQTYYVDNVAVIDADNEIEAKEKCLSIFRASAISNLHVYEIDSLPDGWSYYI